MGTPLTHSHWLKGLQAGFDRFTQPRGCVSRISNLIYTKRGALKTCDGSLLLSAFNGSLQALSALFGNWMDIFLFSPIGGDNNYFGIYKDYNSKIVAPSGLVAAVGAAGALTGTYKYVVTALDGAGGETIASNEDTVILASQKGSLTWTAVPNAAGGYNVYRTVAGGGAGTEKLVGPSATNSYLDNTVDGSLGTQTPPAANNTQVCQFVEIPPTSFGAANIILTFPADAIPLNDDTGGGYGGHGDGPGFNKPPTAQGGLVGNLSPLPQMLGFVNKMILILGNGITPYTSDGTTLGTVILTNGFTASYPAWVAATVFGPGDQITATSGGVDYVFTAVQGGTSGGAHPTWPATIGQTVADNNIIWKNSGQVSTSPVPRGAAHGEIYAGSLWVANTAPTISSDQLDGPSALRMSDINNPNIWNPLNAAQVSPDDGDQATAIKAFTVAEAGIAPQNFLMFFKNFATYLIQGVFGSSNFSITRLQTDMGCIAGRSVQFVPGFGIMRLTHLGFGVTDGIRDRLENPEAIRPFLFGGEDDIAAVDYSYIYFAKGAQTANPPMYCCAVPVLPTIAGAISGVSAAMSGAGSLPSGAYYVKAFLVRESDGQYLEADEVLATGGPGTAILVSLPGTSDGIYWILYYGLVSGEEGHFAIVGPSLSNEVKSITVPGPSGTPGSSNGWLSRIFCYDLVLKQWSVVDLPFPISVLKQFRVGGSIPITIMGGFWDSGVRRWQSADVNWDAGATNNFAADTEVEWDVEDSNIFDETGTRKLFVNRVIIRGDGDPDSVTATPKLDGRTQNSIPAQITRLGTGQFEARIRLLRTLENMSLELNGKGQVEIEAISYDVTQKPYGAALIYS